MYKILDISPDSYQRNRLHTQERAWAETNCYVDIWIELLHALGHEPQAALAFTLAIDFEGDQWTFFKYPLPDLYQLYGLEVQELAVWKPLTEHIQQQVKMGRPVLVELDSFYLPDTHGMAYREEHVKSTVAVNEIDMDAQRLGYFHGQGYYELTGEDFVKVFRLDDPSPANLPPYVEIVKRHPDKILQGQALLEASLEQLKTQLSMMPEHNPFELFKESLAAELEWLLAQPLETFHLYSFATLRQFGACYELAENYIRWLEGRGIGSLSSTIEALNQLSEQAKIYQFQLARAVQRKKPLPLETLDKMAETWRVMSDQLKQRFL